MLRVQTHSSLLMTTVVSLVACSGPTPAAPRTADRPASTSSIGGDADAAGTSAASERCGPADAALVVRFRTKVDRSVKREHGIDAAEFSRAVLGILCDERGWLRSQAVRYVYDPGGPYLIGLRSRRYVKSRCEVLVGEPVSGDYSCASSAYKEVVINVGPWYNGTPGFPGNLRMYRRMVMNHEVGHVMTLRHRQCPGDDRRAPVMMQQSIGMNLNGYTCRPNPWPLERELAALRAAH